MVRAMLMSLLRIISRKTFRSHGRKTKMFFSMREVKLSAKLLSKESSVTLSAKLLSNESSVTSQEAVAVATTKVVWEDVPPSTRLITTHP